MFKVNKNLIENYFCEQNSVFSKISPDDLSSAINFILEFVQNKSYIYIIGNGGSALTAQHYVNDWNKAALVYHNQRFKSFTLVDNIGLVTSYGNDLSYDDIFSYQLKSLLEPSDLVIAISGSGNSPNVLNGVKYANNIGAKTLGLVGYDGGSLIDLCSKVIHVESNDMQICEDFFGIFGHLVMRSFNVAFKMTKE